MSRFIAEVKGERGPATRLGRRSVWAEARGWDLGVKVVAQVDEHGRDCFLVYATGGSNGSITPVFLTSITADDAEGFVSR